jgi:hypothetical protein
MRPDDLSDEGRVDALIAWEKLASWVQARQYRVLAAMADNPILIGGKPDKGWVREDVQAALGVSAEIAHRSRRPDRAPAAPGVDARSQRGRPRTRLRASIRAASRSMPVCAWATLMLSGTVRHQRCAAE